MPQTDVTYSARHWAEKARKAAELAIQASEGNGNNTDAHTMKIALDQSRNVEITA